MLLLKFITLFMMLVGLFCTLAPKLHGTVIIFFVAVIYALLSDISVFQSWVGTILILLVFLSEVGARGLRILLTRKYRVSRQYSVDTFLCNVAGIIVMSTLLGALFGMVLWEIIVGKTLVARFDVISKILIRLLVTAGMRWLCGLLMMLIIVRYIMCTI